MSDTTNPTPATETTPAAEQTAGKAKHKTTDADKAAKAIFTTAAERDAKKPDNANLKPAEGTLGDKTVYTWADGYGSAYTAFGKHFGIKVKIGGGKPQQTIAAMSDDELEAELARRKAAQQPAPAAEQPAEQPAPEQPAEQPAPEQPAEGGRRRRGK
jgi:hypothetical protein